ERADEVEPSFDVCGAHTLKVGDGFRGLPLRHQDESEVVVSVAIGGVKAHNCPKLLLREVRLFLSDINISEIVPGSGGVGIELQRMLEGLQGACEILLVVANNAQ